MNNRFQQHLVKELRPLLIPWIGAVIAGCAIALKPFDYGAGFEGLITLIVAYGFLGGLTLAATVVFGQELHDRTLPLLLVQPIDRSSIWRQKILVSGGAVLAGIIAVLGLLTGISGWYSGDEVWSAVRSTFPDGELLLAGVFLLATVCSCGYWTFVARSIVGGVVFTATSQLLTALAVALVWAKIRGYDQPFEDRLTVVVTLVAGMIYSGLFLWLSYGKFVRLELKGPEMGTSAFRNSDAERKPRFKFLKARPRSPLLNLVRKELRLQKPVAQLAGTFAAFWAGTVLLQRLRPEQNINYMFDVSTCLFTPVSALLAGCISLGEEKTLGMTAPQMALPFPARLQWLTKLVVSGLTGVILSLGLPLLLFVLTFGVSKLQGSTLMNSNDNGFLALSIITALMFLLGFWASTLTSSTVKAALLAICGVVTLPAIALLGIYWASVSFGTPTGPRGEEMQVALWLTAALGVVLLLWQSVIQFRRSEERKPRLFSYSITLGGFVLWTAFLVTCVV